MKKKFYAMLAAVAMMLASIGVSAPASASSYTYRGTYSGYPTWCLSGGTTTCYQKIFGSWVVQPNGTQECRIAARRDGSLGVSTPYKFYASTSWKWNFGVYDSCRTITI